MRESGSQRDSNVNSHRFVSISSQHSSDSLWKESPLKHAVTKQAVYTLIGGVLIHIALGSFYTWGNLSGYVVSYMRAQGNPTIRIRDVGFVLSSLFLGQAVGMPFAGSLLPTLGPRWMALFGGAIMCGGIGMSAYTLGSMEMFVLSYGFLYGFGLGLTYSSPLICALRWYPDNKGFASGVITAGFGAGALIFNQIQTFIINPYNIKADSIPYFISSPNEKYFSNSDLLNRVPSVFPLLAITYFTLISIGAFMLSAPKETNDEKILSTQPILTPLKAIKTKQFCAIITLFYLNGLAITFIASFWKPLGASSHLSDRALSLIGSLAAVFNAGGRLFWGQLADRRSSRTALMSLSLTWTLAVATLPLVASNRVMYLLSICINFFCLGGNFSLFPAITVAVFGPNSFASVYGLVYGAQLLASVTVALLTRFLLGFIGLTGIAVIVSLGCCTTAAISFVLPLIRINLGLPLKY